MPVTNVFKVPGGLEVARREVLGSFSKRSSNVEISRYFSLEDGSRLGTKVADPPVRTHVNDAQAKDLRDSRPGSGVGNNSHSLILKQKAV